MRQVELLDAYVVRIQPWGESSVLYRLVVRDYGWVSVIHKGARAARRQRALPSLTPVRVSWTGRGELQTLVHGETGTRMIEAGQLKIYALYVNEIISYLLPKDRRSDEIYPLYHKTLELLQNTDDPELALRGIELDFLNLAGHPQQLDHTESAPVQASRLYRYCPDDGAIELPDPDAVSNPDMVVSGNVLLALHERRAMDDQERVAARKLMRQVIDFHVSPHVINTRLIMHALR